MGGGIIRCLAAGVVCRYYLWQVALPSRLSQQDEISFRVMMHWQHYFLSHPCIALATHLMLIMSCQFKAGLGRQPPGSVFITGSPRDDSVTRVISLLKCSAPPTMESSSRSCVTSTHRVHPGLCTCIDKSFELCLMLANGMSNSGF